MDEPDKPQKTTPPKLAKRWGVSTDKILSFIRSGELRAIDGATKRGGRPRYLIDERDIVDFEERRAVMTHATRPKKNRKSQTDVIQFF
jgi:transposase